MKAKRFLKKPRIPHLRDKTTGLMNFSDYRKASNKVAYWIGFFLLVIFAFIALSPIVWLFLSAMKTNGELYSTHFSLFPAHWDFAKIWRVMEESNLWRYYLNSFIVCLGAIFFAVLFNSMLAYAVAVIKPFGYKVVNVLVMLGYMIPGILSIYPLSKQIASLGGVNHYLFLWLAFGANAYYYMLFKDHFARLPKSLMEASKIDGCGNFETFIRVAVPLSKSIIGVVAIFAMTASYSDFLLPYLILNKESMQTLMVGIFNLSSSPTLGLSEFLTILSLSIIPQIIVFAIFQKQIMNQGATTGSKE